MSAAFAALTAIFAKLGVEQISPDAATFLEPAGVATGRARGVTSARCTSAAPRARRRPMRHWLA